MESNLLLMNRAESSTKANEAVFDLHGLAQSCTLLKRKLYPNFVFHAVSQGCIFISQQLVEPLCTTGRKEICARHSKSR